ncbi:hypothetical protein [Pseudobythopirellula maris]|nr:hypothetical protein [Pseudobythopirellula maris]
MSALLCLKSGPAIESCPAICEAALSEYWIATRCRLNEWGRRLRALGDSQTNAGAASAERTTSGEETNDPLTTLAEEIVATQLLTRAVAAVTHAYDTRHGRPNAGPIGRNALEGHNEALSRLRAIVFAEWRADSPQSRHLTSLGSSIDHWSDALLAYVGPADVVRRFAIDPDRLTEFAYDARAHGENAAHGAEKLMLLSIRAALQSASRPPIDAELNRRIAGAALGLLGAEAFDGLGLPRSPWMARLERSADETIAMVDRLFSEEAGSSRSVPLPDSRWRV